MTNKPTPLCADGISPIKRIAAIHDLSCFGRCALTVIIPTLSAMGFQVVPIPTCLLSTHTGGFDRDELYFEDMSHAIEDISSHFDKLDLSFDAIYTGFLGSAGQIDSVKRFIDRFEKKETIVLVDPVMGDDGKLYSTYTDELMRRMSELCTSSHLITPNLTEACFLTGIEYASTQKMNDGELRAFAERLCLSLRKSGAKDIVITGIEKSDNELCVCGMRDGSEEMFIYSFRRVSQNYPGTGDLFASVLLGSLLRGDSLECAVRLAADFTCKVMEYTSRFPSPIRDGVALEAFLGELTPPSPSK